MTTIDFPNRRRGWILASACGLGLFLALVAAQPLLAASYDPLRQGVSEFVHADGGRLVTVAFLAWAFSLLVLGHLVATEAGPRDGSRWMKVEGWAFAAAALGLFVVSIFDTDRGAERAAVVTDATTAGALHNVGSALTSVAIFAALTVEAVSRRRSRRALALSFLLAALASSAVLFALGDPLPGLRQRFLVLAASLWQAVLLRLLWTGSVTSDRSSAGSRCSTS
jgi:Protein of unknown function (DUF998)